MYNELIKKSKWLRQSLFKMAMKQKCGHIPSSFSMVEILISIYYSGIAKVFNGDPSNDLRDYIFVSKGHAAMAQYPILSDLGFFSQDELGKFTQPDGILGLYADNSIPGIEGISGSLGHGVGMGAGISFDAKKNNKINKSFVIIGDGECYEGSIWESAMFASHHELDNLIVIVDLNHLCILGETNDLLSQGDLGEKWKSFGWHVEYVDGHSYTSIIKAFDKIGETSGKPLVLIADTVKGKGISFMEGQAKWHNKMPNDDLILQARQDLENNPIKD
jgi:transketolase